MILEGFIRTDRRRAYRALSRAWTNAIILSVFPVLASAYLLTVGHAYVEKYILDLLIAVDGGYRIAAGQVPHVDFHAPMGALNFWAGYLAMQWGEELWSIPIWMGVIAAASLAVPLALVLATRLEVLGGFLVSLSVTFLLATPMVVGGEHYSFGMLYNNYGWAVLLLIGLLHIDPVRSEVAARFDPAVLAGLLALLLFTKISFFVAGVVLALPFLMTGPGRRTFLLAGAAGAALVVVLQSVSGLPLAYASDLLMASEASGVLRYSLKQWLNIVLVQHGLEIFICLVVPLALLAMIRALTVRDFAIAACLLAGSLFAFQQNYQGPGMAALAAFPLIALARLLHREDATVGPPREASALQIATGSMFLAAIAGAFPYAEDRGLKYLNYFIRSGSEAPLGAPLEGLAPWRPYAESILFHEAADEDAASVVISARFTAGSDYVDQTKNYEYMVSLIEGTDLAERTCRSGSIATFGFFNPFNLLMGRPPLTGEMVLHMNRTFSKDRHPTFEEQYGGARCFLVPKVTLSNQTALDLAALYDADLRARFQPTDESAYWTLWTPR